MDSEKQAILLETAYDGKNSFEAVETKIANTKIKRFDWNFILGMTLKRKILILMKQGYNEEEVYREIMRDRGLERFMSDNNHLVNKICDNLKTSISARFGKTKSAEMILG